jgi:hypothetical protein
MVCPDLVAGGASAAPDAGRWCANLETRQEVVRDCRSVPMALARDFPWAWIGLERRASPSRPDVRERRPERQPQDAWQVALYPPVWQVAPPEALMAFLRVQRQDESELQQARSLPAQQASLLAAPPLVLVSEPVP